MNLASELCAVLLIAGVGCAFAVAPHPSWENSLKPRGVPGSEITLAQGGKALYSIIIPSDASTQEEKAAEDLAYWLGEIARAELSVHRESDPQTPSDRFISIGNTKTLARSGLRVPDLEEEGYMIEEKGGNLFLAGGSTRGPINAVYALLEEDLGCRWYSRFSQTIPVHSTLKFRPVRRTFVPLLEIRDPFYWEAFDGTWSLRNRTNAPRAPVPAEWGGHKAYAMFVHTFDALVPPARYFADHPEYFSEIGGKRTPGQLCVSNPDVLQITIESVKRVLKENPDARIMSVSQNDTHPCCACEECKALADAEGSLAGPLLKFVNAVAEEVGRDFPNVRISTLAYLDTYIPPKTIKPHKNVAIQLCTDTHAWPHPFLTIEESERFQSSMKAWAAMGAQMHIWDYTVNFSHYPGPMPNWQVVTDSIRFFTEHNAKGVMLQGNYQTPGTADGHMRCWVWAKLMWDPTLDTRSLMKDFVFGYCGKSAEPIWDYQEHLWETWEREHHGRLKEVGGIRYPMTIFGEEFMEKARDCFRRAHESADDLETRRRVEEAELQILYAELCQWAESGKPADPAAFKASLDRFERIAKRISMTHIQEGAPDFEQWIARMRQLVK